MIRAMSKKQFKHVSILSNIIFGFFVVLMFLVVLVAALLFFLYNMGFVSKANSNIAYYICFVFAGGMLIFDTCFAIYSGVVVIRTIGRNNTIQLQRNPNLKKQENYSNPFIVTFGLLVGLILCILCQLIAAGVASAVGSDKSILKVVWHFFSCLAVLIFAVLSLLMFYPLFVRAEHAIKEMNLDTTSHDHKSARSTAKKSERSEKSEMKVQSIEPSEGLSKCKSNIEENLPSLPETSEVTNQDQSKDKNDEELVGDNLPNLPETNEEPKNQEQSSNQV
ncbi:predicted protein [Naegleria gruberi]|uniref:Predicted protein n=1 Tax=Naegleria gruberi TaxID=5762 RepID=D2VEB0_NAEGR|nr:uncharacterized protein NAEGRDRAFT_67213 [Naegleria gruberi]EFC44848.1 predicted protein [Naegleria gruberi]|eukprot:XP_002677592.1 predicted protein [Naegleria gruberi strain NEG-M]